MRKIVSSACVVLVLVLGACGDDDDGASGEETSDTQEGGDDDLRSEYVEAIATAVTGEDSPFADLGDADAECIGAAYVDTIGVDELEAKVTPEQIRDEPESDHEDWGITMTDEQGTEIYRALLDCSPDAEQAIAAGIAEGFTQGFTEEAGDAFDVDEECLVEVEPASLEGFMGAAIAQGDDFVPNEAQGAALLEWFGECVDLRGAFMAAFTSDPSLPEGTAECLDESVDDRMVDEFWQLAFTSGGDQTVFQTSPVVAELSGILNTCAGGAPAAETTTTAPAG
jgi:hypothetical protein